MDRLVVLVAALLPLGAGAGGAVDAGPELQRQLDAAQARAAQAQAEAARLREQLELLGQQYHPQESSAVVPSTATRHPSSEVAGAPVAWWASQPVRPGEMLLLAVTNMENSTKIELRQGGGGWTAATPLGVTDHGCTVAVPAGFRYAEFEVRADGGAAALAVNRPSPWFVFGDGGEKASPSGWIRVVGEAIGLEHSSTLILRSAGGGPLLSLTARTAPDGGGQGAAPTRWHAFYDIPASFSPGSYVSRHDIAAIWVAFFSRCQRHRCWQELALRGSGGVGTEEKLCTFINPSTPCLSAINISAPKAWPSKVFRVAAQQPGIGRNATAAVLSAMADAKAAGGGVVFFPRGQCENDPICTCALAASLTRTLFCSIVD